MTRSPNSLDLFNHGAVREFLKISPNKPDLLYPFNLSASSNFGEFRPTGREISSHDVVARGLERFMHAIRSDFPVLSESLWLQVLEAAASRTEMQLDEVLSIWPDVQDQLAYDEEAMPQDITPLQQIAVVMVIELYFSSPNSERDLRKCVAEISGRPKFSVYADDPVPYEFWEVSGFEWIDQGEIARMHLTHSIFSENAFDTMLTIRRAKKGFSARGLEPLLKYSGPKISAYEGKPIDDAIRAGAEAFFAKTDG